MALNEMERWGMGVSVKPQRVSRITGDREKTMKVAGVES